MADPVGYRRPPEGSQPRYLHPPYKSSVARAPGRPLVLLPHTLSEVTGPVYGHDRIGPADADLTKQYPGEPIGERIIVTGRVLDEDGRPVPRTLVELWQCNATGRYRHALDQHVLPDPPPELGQQRVDLGADVGEGGGHVGEWLRRKGRIEDCGLTDVLNDECRSPNDEIRMPEGSGHPDAWV